MTYNFYVIDDRFNSIFRDFNYFVYSYYILHRELSFNKKITEIDNINITYYHLSNEITKFDYEIEFKNFADSLDTEKLKQLDIDISKSPDYRHIDINDFYDNDKLSNTVNDIIADKFEFENKENETKNIVLLDLFLRENLDLDTIMQQKPVLSSHIYKHLMQTNKNLLICPYTNYHDDNSNYLDNWTTLINDKNTKVYSRGDLFLSYGINKKLYHNIFNDWND